MIGRGTDIVARNFAGMGSRTTLGGGRDKLIRRRINNRFSFSRANLSGVTFPFANLRANFSSSPVS